MRFQGVFFDLDGTLIHTTHLYADACIAGMRALGLEFTMDDFKRLYPTGGSMAAWIEEKGGDPGRLEEVRTARDIVYHDLLSTQTEFMDGAPELLKRLSGRTGVVTNSWRTYLDAIHRCISLYDHLEHVVTADDMGDFYKPHPHGLLVVADRVKAQPEKSAYVGDQIFDLKAAKAAGMTAILIHGPHTPGEAPEHADIVVKSLQELETYL